MIRLIVPAGFALVFATGHTVSTDYSKERSLRIESVTTFNMEQTSFEMEIDGESRDRPGGGQSSQETRTTVQVDTVLEHEDGEPTRVRRVFEEMTSSSSRTFGDQSRDSDRDGALHEVTIEITVDEDGDVITEVAEGSEPDDDAALAGHVPTLALDALLPDGEVDVDDTWDIESDDVMRALGLDLSKALFPPAPREEGGGGGRGGGRGGFRGRGGASTADMFTQGEWEGEATLVSVSEEYEGESCVVIEVKFETSGDLPEQEFRGGRRGRAPGSLLEPAAPRESTFEIELEGRLFFSVENGRPVYFEIEGTMTTERNTERDIGGDRHMSMSSTSEGTFTHTVTVTEQKSE